MKNFTEAYLNSQYPSCKHLLQRLQISLTAKLYFRADFYSPRSVAFSESFESFEQL